MVTDGSELRIAGESQDLRALSRKGNAQSTSLVIEPPRPGHAFGQVVRTQSGVNQMHGTWNNMHVGSGAVLEPPGDSLDTLYQAWKTDATMGSECLVSPFAYEASAEPGTTQLSAVPCSTGSAMAKCPGMPSTCGSGVMMVNGGRLNAVASANLQGTHSGGVVSPHATSVDSDKSSTIADVEMMLPQTPCLPKAERKRNHEMHMDAVEQLGGKGSVVLQQYQGGAHGLMVQSKRARSLEMPVGSVGSMPQTGTGGYVPSSLQLSAALVQPGASPGLLLDSKHLIAPSTFTGTRGAGALYGAQLQGIVPRGITTVPSSEALTGPLNPPVRMSSLGRSQRLTMVPMVSHGEITSPQVQFGYAQMPSQNGQAVVTAQAALQMSQAMSPRLQAMSALEAVRAAGGSFSTADGGLVGRMSLPARLPGDQGMRHAQVFSGHALSHSGLPTFAEGFSSVEDSQGHSTPKRRVQRKRENLPKESTALLKQWLLSHMLLPYPGNEEKLALCRATNLDMAQINNWFINARVRIWKPLVQKVFDKYEPVLKSQAEEEKDEQQLKRIRDARKSSTLNMITLLSGVPEARKELDEIASKSKALSKDS